MAASLAGTRVGFESSDSTSSSSRHLNACAHCQAELAMLRSFESSIPSEHEGAAAAWIAARLQRQIKSAPAVSPARSRPWLPFPRFSYLSGTAAVAATLALVFSLYISDRPPRPSVDVSLSSTQTMRSGSVRLTSPAGDLDRPSENLRWEAYPGATTYLVEVMEVDGTVVWTRHSSETLLASSPELRLKIDSGKPLLWRVTALNDSGNAIASSDRARFRLKLQNSGQAPGR